MSNNLTTASIGQEFSPFALDTFNTASAAGDSVLLISATEAVQADAIKRSNFVTIDAEVPAPASAITCGITADSKAATAAAKAITFGVGAAVTGTGIQAGTVVESITSGTAFTLSKPATATNASASLTFGAGKGKFVLLATRL